MQIDSLLPGFLLSLCLSLGAVAHASVALSDDVTVIHEKQGNASFTCTLSGPCSPCSYSEKQNNDIYQCSRTGYREPYKCVETINSDTVNRRSLLVKNGDDHISNDKLQGASNDLGVQSSGRNLKHVRKLGVESVISQLGFVKQRTNGNSRSRTLFEAETVTEDGRRIYHMHRSCLPSVEKDRLSVLGFEGIMLALLAVCGPIVYYRKRRNFLASGATRSNARF